MLASPYRVVIVSSIGPALDALLDTLDKRDVFQSGITFLFLGNVSYFFEQRRTEFEKKRFFGEESPLRGLFSLIGWSTSKKLKSFHKFEKKWIDFFKNHTEAELGVETYVCAVTLMLGLLKYPDFISPNTPFSEFLNVSHWEGPGGPLNYNKHYSLNSHMFLSNWQNAGMLDVAEFSVGDSSIDIRQPMFVGGSRVTPSDSPELKDLTVNSSTWMGLTLIIVSSVVGMVCVISIWVYAAHARHALLKPATPTYTIWMLVGLLFVLASDVSQLYIQWHWGCHLTLLLGLFGMGLVMGPLLAKHFLILQVYEVPFKVIGGGGVGGNGGTSSPSPSNPSATVTSSKKWFRKNVGFLINLNFSWSSSPFFPSKPNMLALVIFFIYILLGGLYILLTPLEGELHPIDSFCQAYLCLPKSHSHEHKEVYFNETTHNPLFYLLALYHVLLILTMLWMSWQSQKVTEKKIKFTRDLGITAYIVALIGSLLFLSWVLDELLYPISFWVRSIGLLLLSILFLTLYVLPPILKLNHHHRRFQVSQREIKPPSLPSTNSLATTLPYPGTCPYVYDGRLMYAPPPRSSRFLRWLSFFQPSCTWVQVQAVPQYKFLYLVDLDVGLKYVRVHKKGLASNSISPTSLPTSSTIFQLETNDQVLHSFWTFDEADTEKWLQILKS
ncbi:hypothetical protein HMI54_009628 [Coelomomyces lativittatus]|nr:hypothetical protein HMI54_009628 [Coelomomyces lativittatus]